MPNEVSGLTEYLFIQRSKRFVKFEIEFFSDLPTEYFNSDIYRIINPIGQDENGMYIYEFVSEDADNYYFTTDLQELTPIEFLLLVEVQIAESSPPNINNSTKDILRKFPSWTKLYEDSLEDATPALAVPESFGGKFINALIGDNLDKIESLIDYYNLSKSITGASTEQITWIYSTNNCPDLVTSVVGDNVSLSRINSYSDFISHTNEDFVYYHSTGDATIFTLRPFQELSINGSTVNYIQNETLVFNMFDEFGAKVGLSRLKMESNENYKKRILDVYINKPGPDIDSFKKTVRRELDLWRAFGATPDSYAAGATPIVLEMQDITAQSKYFDNNGNPTEEFVRFVNTLNKEYPTNWGFVQWSDLIWDYAGRYSEGISYVPFVYDLEFVDPTSKYYQPGIGDLSDLKISIKSNNKYDLETYDFDDKQYHEDVYEKQFKFKLSGIEKTTAEDTYAPINLDISYFTEYDIPYVDGDPATINYVVEVDVSGNTYYTNITDYYKNRYTSNAFEESGINSIIDPTDNRTRSDLIFKKKTNDVEYVDTSATPNVNTIRQQDISDARIIYGRFAYSSTTPRYIISGLSETNQSWIAAQGQSRINSSSFANGSYVNPSSPYFSISSPNYSSFQVLYGSNMYTIAHQSANTSTKFKTVTLKKDLSVDATPHYSESFNNFIDHIVTTGGASTPKYLHIENIKPDFSYIDPTFATPTNNGAIGYGGYVNSPEYISDLYIPNISVRTDNSAGIMFATPSYDISNMSSTPNQIAFYWDPNFSQLENQYTLEGIAQRNYPLSLGDWSYFEVESSTPINFKVSNRGVIISSDDYNTSKILSNIILTKDVHRYEFGLDLNNPSNYIINYIEAVKVNEQDDSFDVYTEKRSVKPYYSISQDSLGPIQNVTYLPSSYYEEKNQGEYNDLYLEDVTVRVRLNENANKTIQSEIHSGWYYANQDETYVYARPVTEFHSIDNTQSTPSITLGKVVRQGAPVIIESMSSPDFELSQVSFPDKDDNTKISFINVEYITATSSNAIYLGYSNVHDLSIYDPVADNLIVQDAESSTNIVNIYTIESLPSSDPFEVGREYKVTYKVRNSYYVDSDNKNSSGLYSNIVFNGAPTNGATQFYVTYESSIFENSTPTGLIHSPSRTLLNEGYVYVDETIYDYQGFTASTNSGSIMDDNSKDYMTITIESFDVNNNPKPYQKYSLESSLLIIDDPVVETDIDGFAKTKARYDGPVPSTYNSGTLYISGIVDGYSEASDQATVNYDIIKSEEYNNALYAEPSKNFIEADGVSTLYVNGQITSKTQSVSNVYVYYRRARTVNEIFEETTYDSVLTNSDGSFKIGPITAQSIENAGYWFMAIETAYSSSISSSPVTISGDIVSWFEDSNDAILNGLDRRLPVQDTYEADEFVEFKATPAFKVNYITGNPETATATPNISLPKWFRIPRYTQYQLGILGSDYYYVNNNKSFYPG